MQQEKILELTDANAYARSVDAPVMHDHISLVRFDDLGPIPHTLNRYHTYAIFAQKNFPMNLRYGVGKYISAADALMAVSPGQLQGQADDGDLTEYHGWALFFDEYFVSGTDFKKRLSDYHFFSYNANEALRLTAEEMTIINGIMCAIQSLLGKEGNNESKDRILQDYIILLCDYIKSFYDSQFNDDKNVSSDILSRFQQVLIDYYEKEMQYKEGLPTVRYCAGELYLSPGYLGDILRANIGQSPLKYIHQFVISRAKSLIMSGKNINQTSIELGFEYPQHFTRLFKNITGVTPSNYLKENIKARA